MSKVKSLMGDMEFEEFLAKRKWVLDRIKGLDVNRFNDISCDIINTFYNCWLDMGGRLMAGARMYNYYGGRVTTVEQVDEFAQYLLDKFIDWLESFK